MHKGGEDEDSSHTNITIATFQASPNLMCMSATRHLLLLCSHLFFNICWTLPLSCLIVWNNNQTLALGSAVLVRRWVERGEMRSQHCNESVYSVICLTQNLSATAATSKKKKDTIFWRKFDSKVEAFFLLQLLQLSLKGRDICRWTIPQGCCKSDRTWMSMTKWCAGGPGEMMRFIYPPGAYC